MSPMKEQDSKLGSQIEHRPFPTNPNTTFCQTSTISDKSECHSPQGFDTESNPAQDLGLD